MLYQSPSCSHTRILLDISIQDMALSFQVPLNTNHLVSSLSMDPIPTHSALLRETFLCALVTTTGTQTSSPRKTCASSTKSGDSLHHRAQTHHSQSFPTYTTIAGQSVCGYDAQTLCHPSLRYLMRYKSNCLQFTRLTWHQYLDCSYLN